MFTTSLKLAYSALLAKKRRTFLTILGISIGIAVVIAIMAAGRGLDAMIMGELEVFSPNTVNIEVKVPSTKQQSTENAMGQATGITITTLKNRDLEDIRKYLNIVAAYGWIMGQEVVSYGGQAEKMLLFGQGAQMIEVEKVSIADGRFYTLDEENSLAQVVVIGSAFKTKFFGDDSAVGKTIYIKSKPFRVVGVMAKRGAMSFMDMDDVVYVPGKTMQKRILGIDHYTNIISKMKDRSLGKQTVADLAAIIRDNHDITDPNKDDFAINTMDEMMGMMDSVLNGIIFLLVALVCVSLVVGGVGIMNIMYVSVTERTFEIGLRKSVGATKKDIMRQFLTEALLLTLAGGVLGIIIGAVFALLIYWTAIYYNLKWIYAVPLSSIILAVGFSAAVGLLFGLYPARKAANLDPIEALRRE